ncbi:MAG TPA: MarR family winged helix-turn-helix transcriptional regulator [Jatrophihabitans sp.]|nr:MarR family winged helix-turn-helix transcriptional regulator [Jatrophihabitans sp.]
MPRRSEVAFLLAQLGAFAAERFGERAHAVDFSRPQAGLLRLIARRPGQSQQAVADQLGLPASRLVALVDGLQTRGLVERRRNPDDRRHHALYLTEAGQEATRVLGEIAAEHESAIVAPLSATERNQLNSLLAKLADAHGLRPGIHPGYRHVGARATPRR